MLELGLAAVTGAAAVRAFLPLVMQLLRRGGMVRANYRGQPVPTALGVLPAVVGAVAGLVGDGQAGRLFALGLAGFAALGLLDDAFGSREVRGLVGHLQSALAGRPTTGLAKAVGGLALSVAVAMGLRPTLLGALMGGLCLALAANAVNLLDLRPGRALKAFSASCLVLVPEVGQLGAAALFGAGCALLPEDLGERAMLGDAGSNALGFALGFWTLELPLGVTLAVLALLAGLHVYAERGSLSALIDAVGPLRYLDRLGRRPYP